MRQRNWKVVELHTAATSFKFLPLIILYPFILSFIVRPLSIQHVCNCLLLQRKTDFTIYKFITTLLAKKNIPTNLESYSYKCAIVLDCLLQMVYPYGPTLMVLHVENIMEIVWLKYVLVLEGILDRIHELSLGEWTPESDHKFDCENVIEDNKQLYLSMNLKRVPMYSKIVRICYKWQKDNMVPH